MKDTVSNVTPPPQMNNHGNEFCLTTCWTIISTYSLQNFISIKVSRSKYYFISLWLWSKWFFHILICLFWLSNSVSYTYALCLLKYWNFLTDSLGWKWFAISCVKNYRSYDSSLKFDLHYCTITNTNSLFKIGKISKLSTF